MTETLLRAAMVARAWRTPLGSDVKEVVRKLENGVCAAKPHAGIPDDAYACRLSAPVSEDPSRSRNSRFVRRIGLLAMDAAREAFQQAGIEAGDRFGVFAGYGGLRVHWDEMMPALENQAADESDLWDRGLRSLHPFWMLNHLSNNAHALLAAELGLKGPGLTLAGANAGAQALASAIEQLHAGTLDAALVFAYDMLISPNILVEWAVRGEASVAGAGELTAPYDRNAAGVVPGESACAVVLVRPDDAGANALSRVSVEEGADGAGQRPGLETLSRLVEKASGGVGVVDGDSRARPAEDLAERQMLARWLEPETRLISTSASVGYAGAARPVFQAIALTRILRAGLLPPIARLKTAASGPFEPVAEVTKTGAGAALGIHSGAPGLASVVRVEIP